MHIVVALVLKANHQHSHRDPKRAPVTLTNPRASRKDRRREQELGRIVCTARPSPAIENSRALPSYSPILNYLSNFDAEQSAREMMARRKTTDHVEHDF
jgi:hypothetical protein